MLNEKLENYLNDNYYPFHMPGHKRNKDFLNKKLPYDRDITEISGFDNLNDPKSLFVYMEDSLANIYNIKEAIISTNGSTCGILASIRSLSKKYKKILISRSSHKSIFNAIELFNLDVDYIKNIVNDNGIVYDIDYKDLSDKLSKNSYDLVILTSPTYEGFLIDLKKVQSLCKKNKTLLVLDMAHGSHINLYEEYKNYFSFDLAITSLHKNLSALTPASCILVNNEEIDTKEIRRNMAIFQTSSPSYLISQSIDDMIYSYPKFTILKENLDINLERLYSIGLKNLRFINSEKKDRTKIIISTKDSNVNGYELQKLLLNRKIEVEMAQASYVLLISTIFDRKEGFELLKKALIDIDKTLKKNKTIFEFKNIIPEIKMNISDAINSEKTLETISNLEGKISAQYIYSYPPGIPLIAPGEIFSKDIIKQIKYLYNIGANLSFDGKEVFVIN
ncbi:MAG: aminotransferase class V-fold PLP-dependent enzyme [Anaerococcus sp.]